MAKLRRFSPDALKRFRIREQFLNQHIRFPTAIPKEPEHCNHIILGGFQYHLLLGRHQEFALCLYSPQLHCTNR